MLKKKPGIRLGRPNKMQPLSEQEEFEFRLRAEREANSNLAEKRQEKAQFQIPQKVGEAIGTGIGVGGQAINTLYKSSLNPAQLAATEAVGNVSRPIIDFLGDAYNTTVNSFVNGPGSFYREVPKILSDRNGVASALEELRKKPIVGGNIPIKQFRGGKLEQTSNIPINASIDDLQKGIQRVGADYMVGRFAPDFVSGVGSGADKNITSVLARAGGRPTETIKELRSLEKQYGRGFVLSKTKSKPAYLNREITPKATELAQGRVRSMNPEAMREIGISPEDTATAQRLKDINSIQEFPTKASADEFYARMFHETPSDVQIPTTSLERAYLQNRDSLSPSLASKIESYTNRTTSSGLGTLEKAPMTKDEYASLRELLNNVDPKGEIPAIQSIKSGLDNDFSVINPKINEAKDIFQLANNTPKIEPYLNKTTLDENIASRLEKASEPKNTIVADSLKRLLGEESTPLIDDAKAQRLAKEMYSQSNLSTRPLGNVNNLLDLVKLPGRFLQRSYEEARSLFNNPKTKPGFVKPVPMPAQINKPAFVPKAKEQPNISEIQKNVSAFEPKPITISNEAVLNAKNDLARYDTEHGRMPYQPQVPNNEPYYPTPLGDNPDVPYKAPTGNLGIKFPEPEPQSTSGAGPYQPIPGNLTYEPTDIPSDIYSPVKKESVSKRISKRNKKGKK